MNKKSVTLSAYDAANILHLTNDLQAEDALEDISCMLLDPSDEQMRGIALESVLKLYASIRTLTRVVNSSIKI